MQEIVAQIVAQSETIMQEFTPEIKKSSQGVNGGDRTALERFLGAVGEPLDRPISIVAGNRQHYRGTLATGFLHEVHTGAIDKEHPNRRPDLAHLCSDASPWVANPDRSPKSFEDLLKGSEGGVTFRPNRCHHENATWQGSRLLFAEWDMLSLDEQREKIEELKSIGFGPTAVVFSGSKSLHCYWALTEIIEDAEQWKALMAWIAVGLGSDPAIVTLHREMRLPGGFRLKNGKWVEQSLLECNPENCYNLDQVESLLQRLQYLPYGMDSDRFRDWKSAKTRQAKGRGGDTPEQVLARDYVLYRLQQKQQQDELAAKRAERAAQHQGQVNLPDLVAQAEQVLGSAAFTPYLECENGRSAASHIRCKPLPEIRVGSGSFSAFLSERNGVWLYSDPNSGEKAMGGFRFWAKATGKPDVLRGRDYVEAAKEFCKLAGIAVPEYQPKPKEVQENKVISLEERRANAERATLAAFKEWQSRRSFAADETINQQYLPAIDLERSKFVAIKSGLGTGKSYQVSRLCSEWEGGVIGLSSRVNLALQMAARINADAPTNLKRVAFIGDSDSYELMDPNGRIWLCIDSLMRVNPNSFSQKILFIDELESVLRHLLVGETVKSRRQQLIKRFELLLSSVQAIVVLDGNLSDYSVRYLESLAGIKFHRLENTHVGLALEVQLWQNPDKQRDHTAIQGELLDALMAGHKCAYVSDSQRELEAIDQITTEAGFKSFRIDSKTSCDKEFKKLMTDPQLGAFLVSEGVDVVLISPSGESGLDIATSGYFSRGFASFCGVLDTNTQLQIMRRVREVSNWVVTCPDYTIRDTVGPTSYFANTLAKAKLDAALLEITAAAYEDSSPEAVAAFMAILRDNTNAHDRTINGYNASRNYEASHTYASLKYTLETEKGFRVTEVAVDENVDIKEKIKEAKERILEADSQRLYEAKSSMSAQEAARKLQAFNCTLDERFQAQRVLLLSRLPGIEQSEYWTPALVLDLQFKNKGILAKLERFWLARHLEMAKNKSLKKVQSVLDGYAWSADLTPFVALIQYLVTLGIYKLIGDGNFYSDASPELAEAFKRAKGSRKAKVLGIAPGSAESPMAWAARIGRKVFGIRTEKKKIDGVIHTRFLLPKHEFLLPFVGENMAQNFGEKFSLKIAEMTERQSVEVDSTISNSNTNLSAHSEAAPMATQNTAPQHTDETLQQIQALGSISYSTTQVVIGGLKWWIAWGSTPDGSLDRVCNAESPVGEWSSWFLRSHVEAHYAALNAA